jgi:itaconate CoA-transferase
MLPLGGVSVLSLEHAVAAPFATRQLADLGARVIKIERLGSGDFALHYDSVNGQSSYFVWLNRSKGSVILDIKTPHGRELLHELAERADVIVQNLGPGAAARLGLSSDEVRERDPGKIVVNMTGWGSDGPWPTARPTTCLCRARPGWCR